MSLSTRIQDACYRFHDNTENPEPRLPNRLVIHTGASSRTGQIAWAVANDFEWADEVDVTCPQPLTHSVVDDGAGGGPLSPRSEAFDD